MSEKIECFVVTLDDEELYFDKVDEFLEYVRDGGTYEVYHRAVPIAEWNSMADRP